MVSRRKSNRRKKSQRIYKMKGCNKTRKYLGGSSDANMAYPSDKVPTVPNPHFAVNANLARAYPATQPAFSNNYLNPQNLLKGGTKQKGGVGNNGIPYPNGLVGTPWTSKMSSWPGVDGVSGNSNHYQLNKYPTDVSRDIINVGAQPPFITGGNKKRKKGKKQKGGTLSNFVGQDLINLGRQLQFGLGTAYNGITGFSAPVNPLPWKGQMPNTPSFASVKAMI